jgi:hypothetical protein
VESGKFILNISIVSKVEVSATIKALKVIVLFSKPPLEKNTIAFRAKITAFTIP